MPQRVYSEAWVIIDVVVFVHFYCVYRFVLICLCVINHDNDDKTVVKPYKINRNEMCRPTSYNITVFNVSK